MHPVFMLLCKVCRNHSYEMENGTTAAKPSSRFYAFCGAGSKSELLADQFYGVEFLPAEILDLPFDFVSVAPKLFGAGIRTIAEVAVGGRRLEDRVRQAEPFDDRRCGVRSRRRSCRRSLRDASTGRCRHRPTTAGRCRSRTKVRRVPRRLCPQPPCSWRCGGRRRPPNGLLSRSPCPRRHRRRGHRGRRRCRR